MSYRELKTQINNFLDQIRNSTGESNRTILNRCCSSEFQRAEIRSLSQFENELNRGDIDTRILEAIRNKLQSEVLRHERNNIGGKKRTYKRKRQTKRSKVKKSRKKTKIRRRHY